jgi:Ca-activated chloride channel family protein
MPPEWDFDGLKIEYQRVDVAIEDQVATTHIDQLFVNENDWMLEGIYLFPLPAGAAVSQLTMWVNGDPIEAKILEADEAREIYDEIVRQLRDPALLEYVGTSAIQANVFPIPPHEERRIEIEYSQILPAEGGLIHYVYPQSTDLYTNTPLDNQSIRVEVRSDEEIRAIYSPSHNVAIDRDGDFRATVGYEAAGVKADRDFELYYSVTPEDIGLNLLSYRESGEDGFFLMLVAPPVEANPDEVVAKDVILVVDTSGSMDGEKMVQAKEAAAFVVDNLNPRDRFNIVSFSTGVRSFSRGLTAASDAGDYQSFINSLEALGGTNISQALLEAVAQADNERPTTVIFLTDGLATEGIVDTPQLLSSVEQQTPGNVRIFAFGVGDDVDTFLLDSLAQGHGGATTYVRPGQQIDEAVSGFYAKVSTPVLADISLDFDNVIVEQLYPQSLPDLFAGTQLVLAGRYRDGGPATITLNGMVNGREQTFVYEDNVFRSLGGDDFIPRLWATRAIGNMLTQIRLHGEDPELVQSVINLSIRYGIITPYTSYLIEEDDIFSQAGRQTITEEAAEEMAAPAEVSGEAAVDMAAAQAEMAEAEAPQAVEVTRVVVVEGKETVLEEAVQFVGSKTFIWRDGVWIDTAYDADAETPEQVGFASDAYFELLSAAPELGQYLSLGSRLLIVHDGVAYEIVEGEGQESVTLPVVAAPDIIGEPDAIGGQSGDNQTGTTPDAATGSESESGSGNAICGSALAAPLMLVGLAVVIGRKRRSKLS